MVPYEVGALVKNIYYDYNKSDIKRLASKELLEIVYFLQDNPAASIQLSSYTDSRGAGISSIRIFRSAGRMPRWPTSRARELPPIVSWQKAMENPALSTNAKTMSPAQKRSIPSIGARKLELPRSLRKLSLAKDHITAGRMRMLNRFLS
jgi:hypothetical protein